MLSFCAPAKINWLLSVLGKRDDGYHEILSLAQCVELCDELSFEPFDALVLESDCPIPVPENLIWKAALVLKDFSGTEKGARITLTKNIPIEAGLGGGSSDAAYTLLGLNELWGLGLDKKRLSALGAKVGSDVPFFLSGPAALVSGRGETAKPVDLGKPVWLVLVKPDFGVSTAWAYRTLRRYSGLTKARDNIRLFIRALRGGQISGLGALPGGNDLEPGVVAAFPEIGRIKAELKNRGALYVSMSGSGSAVLGLFADKRAAERAAERMPWWCRAVQSIV